MKKTVLLAISIVAFCCSPLMAIIGFFDDGLSHIIDDRTYEASE